MTDYKDNEQQIISSALQSQHTLLTLTLTLTLESVRTYQKLYLVKKLIKAVKVGNQKILSFKQSKT